MHETKKLALMYYRHNDWARRSGYAPMEWDQFKKSRQANPLSKHFIKRGAK